MTLLVQSLLVSVIVWIGFLDRAFLHTFLYRPVVIGPLVGLVFGNLSMGLEVGVAIEIMFLAVVFVGVAVPPDETLSTAIATGLACLAGSAEIGIATALPIALIGMTFRQTRSSTVHQWTFKQVEKAAAKANYKGIILWTSVVPSFISYVLFGIPAFIALYYGAEYVQAIIDFIPPTLISGISAGSGMLGAVGIALLLGGITNKKLWPYFLVGFIAASFLGLNMIALALIALTIVAIAYYAEKTDENKVVSSKDDEKTSYGSLTRKDLWKQFKYALAIESGCPATTWEAPGFAQGMIPVIEKIYDTREEKAAAYERHMALFLTEGRMAATVIGIATAMEERHAKVGDIDPESINEIKLALMGPLAGIGDSLLHGTLRPIMAGLACSLIAASGFTSPFGTILFLVVMTLAGMSMRYFGIFKGYEKGLDLVTALQEGGMLDKFTKYTAIAAFIIGGGFVPRLVRLNLAYSYTFQDTVVSLQSILNDMMPNLLPLLYTLLMYWLINKKKMNVVMLMVITMLLGIGLVYLGIIR